jgi:hypothetical protein
MKGMPPARRRVLEIAIEHHPQGLDRHELAAEVGVHENTKSLVNNVGALRSRKLLTEGWPVKAGRVLFLEGV